MRALGYTALFSAGLIAGLLVTNPLQFAAAVLVIFAVSALVVYTPSEQRRTEEEYARRWRERRAHLSPKQYSPSDQFDIFSDR